MAQGSRQVQTQAQQQIQTLSPQQILVVKLLELPTVELEERIHPKYWIIRPWRKGKKCPKMKMTTQNTLRTKTEIQTRTKIFH